MSQNRGKYQDVLRLYLLKATSPPMKPPAYSKVRLLTEPRVVFHGRSRLSREIPRVVLLVTLRPSMSRSSTAALSATSRTSVSS